jgi:MFS family permease
MVDRMGEARLARLGSAMLAVELAAMPFAHTYIPLAFAVALVPLGTAFTFPCVTALLSRVISSHECGLYMGVQQIFDGIALVLGPIWTGFAYDNLGHGVPFWTSSLLVLCTIPLGLRMELYERSIDGEGDSSPLNRDTVADRAE